MDSKTMTTLPRNFHGLSDARQARLIEAARQERQDDRDYRLPPPRIRQAITAASRERLDAERAAFEEDAASRRRFAWLAERDARVVRRACCEFNPFSESERFGQDFQESELDHGFRIGQVQSM